MNKKDNDMEVHQETDEGYNLVSLKSPAVLTVSKPNYDPRYPTIKTKMASRKAVIPTQSVQCHEEHFNLIRKSYGYDN